MTTIHKYLWTSIKCTYLLFVFNKTRFKLSIRALLNTEAGIAYSVSYIGYRLHNRGIVVRFPVVKDSPTAFAKTSRPALPYNQPPIQRAQGAPSPCRKADHPHTDLLLPSAKVKNEWSYTSTPHTPSWRAQEQLHVYNVTTLSISSWRNFVLKMWRIMLKEG